MTRARRADIETTKVSHLGGSPRRGGPTNLSTTLHSVMVSNLAVLINRRPDEEWS